jgi:hypothetical protein
VQEAETTRAFECTDGADVCDLERDDTADFGKKIYDNCDTSLRILNESSIVLKKNHSNASCDMSV